MTIAAAKRSLLSFATLGATVLLGSVAMAQNLPVDDRTTDLHGLRLGLEAEDMDTRGFGEFACGSNGNAPRAQLADWTEFKKCRPEPNGLYEVYVRVDDKYEYLAKAFDDPTIATNRRGTTVAGHPIILSVLFDKDGIGRMIRFVTDPRADVAARRVAHLMRITVTNQYGPRGWDCKDIPPQEGETPVGGVFHHSFCTKKFAGKTVTILAKFFRKPGQADIDPVTKQYHAGYFESSTRVGIFDDTVKPQ